MTLAKHEGRVEGMRSRIFSRREVISPTTVEVPPSKIVVNLPYTLRNFTVKEKHIGSVVSEILPYRHKDRHRLIFIYRHSLGTIGHNRYC